MKTFRFTPQIVNLTLVVLLGIATSGTKFVELGRVANS